MPITDHEALDAALDAYLERVHEVLSVIGLKAPDVDFGDEVSKINAAKAEIDAKLVELRGDVPAVEAEEPETLPLPDAVTAHAEATGDAAEGSTAANGESSWETTGGTIEPQGEPATAIEAHAVVLGDGADVAAEPVEGVAEPVPAEPENTTDGPADQSGTDQSPAS